MSIILKPFSVCRVRWLGRYGSASLLLLVFSLILYGFSSRPLKADELFTGTQSDWMSLDAFIENANKEPEPPVVEAPALTPEAQADARATSGKPTATDSVLAAPERALNYPVMPKGGVGPQITVSSTEEEKISVLQEQKSWRDLTQAEEEHKKQEEAQRILDSKAYDEVEQKNKDPFGVRFTALPSAKVQAIPADRISKPKLDREARAAKAARAARGELDEKKKARGGATKDASQDVAKSEKSVEDALARSEKLKELNAACEAFADYRRRQLEAIESDRRTLAELRAALTDLGLDKKLNFLANQNSSLEQSAEAVSTVSSTAAPATKMP